MAYEHERWIIHLIELRLATEGFDLKEETRAIDEVREVYAKAEAFDQIKVIHDKHIYDFLNMSETECIEKIGDILEEK